MKHNLFETTLGAKPKSTLRHILAAGSVTVHVVVGGAFLILSLWEIQELQRPGHGVAIASPMQIAAPSGGGGGAKTEAPKLEPKKEPKREREQVRNRQPSSQLENAELSTKHGGTGTGTGTGTGEGPGDGPPGPGDGPPGLGNLGICFAADCAPPLPTSAPKEAPIVIQDAELRSMRRISGEAQIQPPSSTKNSMSRAGESSLQAIVHMCLDSKGNVSSQRVVRSSGHPEYDAKLKSGIRRWRYEPYRANGKAVAVCTQLTFVYRQE